MWLNMIVPPDILILGGGPAGLSTALHLAQLAPDLRPRVLVLEKAHYPRHKLCGGALTVDAEVMLQRLGLNIAELPSVVASEAHLDFAGRGLNFKMPRTHALRIIRRDEFDAWLAAKVRQAGIEIREGLTVRSVSLQTDAVLVETTSGSIEAAIVVGADGSNGVTRRCILPDSKIHTAHALEVIAPAQPHDRVCTSSESSVIAREQRDRSNLRADEEIPTPRITPRHYSHAADTAYFDFFPVPLSISGYTWDFPTRVKDQPMRCWGIYDANLHADHQRPRLKQPLTEEMHRQGCDIDESQIRGHPVRWFSPFARLAVPRVILVGDATGVDGIFGEGISFALGYGRIAAQAIHHAIHTDDFSFRDYRRRILRSSLGQALTIRNGITHILYRLRWAWFQKLFWRVLQPIVEAAALVLVLNWAKRLR
jgi:flavin-dependent dehydrogenase